MITFMAVTIFMIDYAHEPISFFTTFGLHKQETWTKIAVLAIICTGVCQTLGSQTLGEVRDSNWPWLSRPTREVRSENIPIHDTKYCVIHGALAERIPVPLLCLSMLSLLLNCGRYRFLISRSPPPAVVALPQNIDRSLSSPKSKTDVRTRVPSTKYVPYLKRLRWSRIYWDSTSKKVKLWPIRWSSSTSVNILWLH